MRYRVMGVVLAGVLAAPAGVLGQAAGGAMASQAAGTPAGMTFEVASVRPAEPMDPRAMMASLRAGKRPETLNVDGLRLTIKYMSLKELIAYGYKVRTYQVSGPEWLATDRFDIVAKLPEGSTRDDVTAMMKALLADRFKLAAHLETKEHQVVGLVLAKSGPKLVESGAGENQPIDPSAPLAPGQTKLDSIDGPIILTRNDDGSTTYNLGARGSFTLKVDGETGTMHMTAKGMTLPGFSMMLTTLGGGNGREVVDMTGLKGRYELAVDFSLHDLVASLRDQGIEIPNGPGQANGGRGAGADADDPAGDSTVSDALGKLGLKLQGARAATPQLVVDHVEKAATEN